MSSFAKRLLTVVSTLVALLSLGVRSFAITGISAGVDPISGERPFRLEINQFSTSGAAWDLYILSLRQLQRTDQSSLLSYFQIAGIHGFPQVPWDGVVGTQGYPGYCTHAAVPFPTWHRPYLALFEQALWNNAQIIARSYPTDQQEAYGAAAATLRIPYWDWAAMPALPAVVSYPHIAINTPTGFETIDNPLFNYTFQFNATGNGFPAGAVFAQFPSTVRHYNSTTKQSNNTAATQWMMSQAPTLLAEIYQLLTSVSNYTTMSCTRTPGGDTNTANNIENIHNSIHNSVGGYGFMTFPEFAGFDPIFWLHHANIDRLFAIWQALYPDSWVEPSINSYGSYIEPIGSVDSATSSLQPFHSDNQSSFHTSESIRSTRTFGYSYPEVVDWDTNVTALAESVRAKVNAMYNPHAKSPSKIRRAESVASIGQGFNHVTFDMAKDLGVNNLETQWAIRLQVKRFAIPSTFTVDFFLGDPPTDARAWATAPNLIGSHAQFISANVSAMHPDGMPDGTLYGEISLTHTLAAGVSRGVLADLTPGSVVPLLAQSLTWRARSYDNCEIGVHKLTDLSIAVGSRDVQPATSLRDFPLYGETTFHVRATEGKAGGAMQGPRHGQG